MTPRWYEPLCRAMRGEHVGTPKQQEGMAIEGRRPIKYVCDFKAIPCIFKWNK